MVKQFGAADDRRNLAMQHLKTTLTGNQDNPMDFLVRDIDYLLCISKITKSAEACPHTTRAPINEAPIKPSFSKSVRASGSVIYNKINSKGLNVKQRAAVSEGADRLMRNDARTRGNAELKMKFRVTIPQDPNKYPVVSIL